MNTLVKTSVALALLFSCGFLSTRSAAAQTQNIEVDFSKVIGTIRALNGVNGGPIVTRGAFDLSANFADLGIQHIRLHDVPWMYENAVDINYIFPRDDADVNDPRSYDFSLTDYYLKSIRALGAEMTFRLGYSAEWRYHPPLHNVPPRDFAQWAAICAHIVEHYNQGWANGFHYHIKYWEIWNESDIPNFWTGTPEQYDRLYELTARGIKAADPGIKVGGPTLAVHLEFLEGFLKYCQGHDIPLDFVPWHIYAARPGEVLSRAAKIQELLNRYGFSKVESVLDEWNYFPANWHSQEIDAIYRQKVFQQQMGGAKGAAFDASVLIGLQDSTVAIADFYQGTNMFWGGLYDAYGVPFKPYYTFKAFKVLLSNPIRLMASGSSDGGPAIIAGESRDKTGAAILISNFDSPDRHYRLLLRNLPATSKFVCDTYRVDGKHNLDRTKTDIIGPSTGDLVEDVENPSVCLIQLHAAR